MYEIIDCEKVTNESLFDKIPEYLKPIFSTSIYPWELLDKIAGYLHDLMAGDLKGFTEISPGVLVGEGTTIAKNATIIAPAIIGRNCEIRPNAYIRGNVITGEGCVIGNATELKNCILLNNVQVPHYNYVGDSILGNNSHMGAGAICSNLKSDKSPVTVKTQPVLPTGLKKFGAILADGADVGCGCVLNPGTVICKNSRVYPLTSVRGVIPPNSIVKKQNDIVNIE